MIHECEFVVNISTEENSRSLVSSLIVSMHKYGSAQRILPFQERSGERTSARDVGLGRRA